MKLKILLVFLAGAMWCEAISRVDLERNLQWMSSIFRGYPRPGGRLILPPGIRPADCPECQCGIPRVTKRVVGGKETHQQLYPWMTLLMYDGMGFCGGTLINSRYVMSAAHCTVVPKENVTMRLLEHDTTIDNENVLNMKVAEIIPHPNYDSKTYENDIALYKLEEFVDLTEKRVVNRDNRVLDDITLRTVCLPPPGKSFEETEAVVTAWGYVRKDGPASNFLRQINVPVIHSDLCQLRNDRKITDNMLCAGFENDANDGCQGDSGGPLLVYIDETNTYQQPGVASFGAGCARPKRYGVYTKVSNYLKWIEDNTSDACTCSDPNIV